jgi:SpoVK/Ycf46/Vps4 family AAA+-type ATPase
MSNQYKFKHLKVFGSAEKLFGDEKKYRKVYDISECRYLYVELCLFNKLFDESEWELKIRYKCTKVDENKNICELNKTYKISKETNLIFAREGWGTAEPGWWKAGKYQWEVFIDETCVASTEFYIINQGLVQEKHNPYFSISSIKLFESGIDTPPITDRKYLRVFSKSNCRYINVELHLEALFPFVQFPLELQFNIYNDAGQHKGYFEYFSEVTNQNKPVVLQTGFGSEQGDYWFADLYTLELIFMDQLIAVLPFQVDIKEIEQEGQMAFDTQSNIQNQQKDLQTVLDKTQSNPVPSFEEAMAGINSLIGLQTVKDKINEMYEYLSFIKIRQEKGFKESNTFNLNAVFLGNPGTGKTTVAQMLGSIYHSMGLLSKGQVHEVTRTDLVGEYIGHTAPKVEKAIEKARGGILFVDEAYSLTERGDDGKDFGQEVIEVLIREMSNGKGDIAFVFAGYPKEMNHFLNKNTGMKSRIQHVIDFPDYTPSELKHIASSVMIKKDISLSAAAAELMDRQIHEVYRTRDSHFGNARYINGLIEECKQNMAVRLMKLPKDQLAQLSKTDLSTIQLEDVEKVFGLQAKKNVSIPVNQPMLEEALKELHSLVGLEDIKRDVDEMAKLVKYYTEIGRDVKKSFSLHTVFLGNPGTGKTTVARIIVNIYKALGVLEKGHLIETDRMGLVAEYIGQTAVKTDEIVQSAMGGGLFIDEAYALTNKYENDFGKEAIDTLLKRMEDHRGEFMLIVAGYPKEMQEFLESNPGLMSRFDRTLHFSDYTVDQLFEIAEDMLESQHLKLSPAAAEVIKPYISSLWANKNKYFGNARTIRKIIGEIVKKQNLRMASMNSSERTKEMISTIEPEDTKGFTPNEKEADSEQKRGSIGFNRNNDK